TRSWSRSPRARTVTPSPSRPPCRLSVRRG
ncbi:MAG: hypothetical protein AVDCRST_MAG88-4674, partial [uncultured Thermomicrobiales bacterium]